jgi:hypothetical protein
MSEGLQEPQGQPEPSTPDTEAVSEAADLSDGWDAAEDAYDSVDTSDLSEAEEVLGQADEAPEVAEGTPEAEPEVEAAPEEKENVWSAEGLDTPEKIAARLKTIQAGQTQREQAKKQEFEALQSSQQELGKVISEVLADPSKITEVIQKYGKGFEENGAYVNWDALTKGQQDPTPDESVVQAATPEQQQQYIESVTDYIKNAEDDADLGKRIGDLIWQSHTQAQTQLESVVGKLLDHVSTTAKGAVEPLIKDQRQAATVNAWDSAISELSSEEGFKQAVTGTETEVAGLENFINNEPFFSTWVEAINKNPEAAAKRGMTPTKLLSTAYKLYSGPQAVEAAKIAAKAELQSKIESTGEMPGVHTETTNTDGMDWDEIQKVDGDPFRGI